MEWKQLLLAHITGSVDQELLWAREHEGPVRCREWLGGLLKYHDMLTTRPNERFGCRRYPLAKALGPMSWGKDGGREPLLAGMSEVRWVWSSNVCRHRSGPQSSV
jgi:hypothetical protein